VIPSQAEFEALLQRLREQQTESPIIDGKADLPLETEGDRAFFIRHVAALANNAEPSHLIIGIEDKTWDLIGLPEDSPLRDSDLTQRRMNQTLTNRVDPNISVRYRTYAVSDVVLGLIAIEGMRAPYIIAIEDQQYGGDRTKGEPSYVYRGAIYVRRGANSVIANRQSEVLEIVSRVRQAATDHGQPDEFLTTYNYLDIDSEDFGRHALSDRLVEEHLKADAPGAEYVPARSWVSFVFYPVDSGCEIDTFALKEKLKPNQRTGREGQWYHGVPEPFLDMFWAPRATPKEFLGTWYHRKDQRAEKTSHFIRIRPSGHIEVGCTYPLFCKHDSARCFTFVTLIGYLWQMIYLSRAIYRDTGFYGETAVLVNLVGTSGTRLADFARGWASPFSPEYSTLREQGICYDLNIQIERRLPLADASDDEIEATIREIARDLGAYYGQDRPRCFDYHTDEFPYREYIQRV
jgi:hypothetical protein